MNATILCVDDDNLVLLAVDELLSEEGYRVLTASGAEQALSILKEHEVDLMIIDVIMPGTDGVTLCRTIRSDQRFPDTPIIMLTAKSSDEDREKGMLAGATVYLPKPISPTKLIGLVSSILKAR